jgi:hypothetical protein
MLIKANFKITKTSRFDTSEKNKEDENQTKKELTQAEFEEFIVKSGASGSFMVFRSDKPDEELGLEEL